MDEIIRFGKVVSHPLRLRLLLCLHRSDLTKDQLLLVFPKESQTKIEAQLDVLRRSDLISSRPFHRSSIYILEEHRRRLIDSLVDTFRYDVDWDRDVSQDMARLGKLP
jgi:hypothetical protein